MNYKKAQIIDELYGGGSAYKIGQNIFKYEEAVGAKYYRGFNIDYSFNRNITVKMRTKSVFREYTGNKFENIISVYGTKFNTFEDAEFAIDKMQDIFSKIKFSKVEISELIIAKRRLSKNKPLPIGEDLFEWAYISTTAKDQLKMVACFYNIFEGKFEKEVLCNLWVKSNKSK